MFTRAIRPIVTPAILTLSTNFHALPSIYRLRGGIGSTDVGPGDVDGNVYPVDFSTAFSR